jgi:hypothetical protein
MGATASITAQSNHFYPFFAKQDKGLTQNAPNPVPTMSAVGDPRVTRTHDYSWRKSCFAKEISPTVFGLLGDPVFRRHAQLRSKLDRNESQISKRTENGFGLTCNLLSYCSGVARHYRQSDYYDHNLKPETMMDMSLAFAVNGVTKEACYEANIA